MQQHTLHILGNTQNKISRLCLKCDGTRSESSFRLSAKRTSPFKSAGASVQSTTGSRGVRISGSNAGYTMFRGSVKGTGYPLHSPVSPSLPLPCVTVCHHISTGLYQPEIQQRLGTSKTLSTTSLLIASFVAQQVYVQAYQKQGRIQKMCLVMQNEDALNTSDSE